MSAPTGDTSYQVKLDFPDAKAREDFEAAFRAWLKGYQQRATMHRTLGAALTDAAEGDDTAGHLLEYYDKARKKTVYINFI